jgi:hypothetical protein
MITVRQYTVIDDNSAPNVGFGLVANSQFVITSPLAADENLIGVTHGSSDKLGFPGAAQYVWLIHGSIKTYAYAAPAMTRLTNFDFPTPAGAARMYAWGDIVTNAFLGFRTTSWSDTSVITKLTNNHWVSPTSDRWWVSSTWHDPDATGGTHETTQGTRSSIIMKKRAGLVFTVPTYPERPFPTTTDDATAARVYLGRGNSDPGRAAMERVAELDFPSDSPGKVTSADGAGWVLSGDGVATLAAVEFDATKPGFSSAAMRALEFRYTDTTALGLASSTPVAAGVYGGAGTFVAPVSGIVTIAWGGLIKSRLDTTQWAATGIEVRTGSTVGSGTSVLAWSTNEAALNYNVSLTAVHREKVVTGLTPGDTYNVRQVAASSDTTAGAQLFRGYVTVTPSA